MTSLLVTGIGELTTCRAEPGVAAVDTRPDAAFVVERGRVAWVGPSREAPAGRPGARRRWPRGGPGLRGLATAISSSPATAAQEFAARMAGERYAAGGIRTTVAATRAATDEQLTANVARHVAEMRRQGTTTVEIKSGYGLTRARRGTRAGGRAPVHRGDHVPRRPRRAAGVRRRPGRLRRRSSPARCSTRPHRTRAGSTCSARRGAFDADQARAILLAGRERDLGGRLHANQLGPGPGVRLACELGLVAVDHCTYLADDDVSALRDSGTIATLLPGVEFSTRSPYPDARALVDAGVRVALASDCNPGSCYTSSMPLCVALAVREMRMTPAEALWSATAGGALALGRDDVGRLAVGSRADYVVLDAPSYLHLAYRPGVPLVAEVSGSTV